MFDYLIDHALKNVWCTPNQDQQVIVKPARLTPVGGVWNNVQIQWRVIPLPVKSKRFHVYQIGQLHPLLLGLFPIQSQWMTISEACNRQKLIADLFSDNGVQFPRHDTWYMVTRDKNLIFAVREPDPGTIGFNLDFENFYFRVYSNAYYNSDRAAPLDDFVYTEGMRVIRTQDILDMQTKFNQYAARPRGVTYAFVNGYKVSSIDLISTKVNDVVEFVYDSAIKRIVDFSINDLRTFVSKEDLTRKYLLHFPGLADGIIDFQDDVDAFLIKHDGARHKGVFIHKNLERALRMVTHKDYSIDVDVIQSLVDGQPEWLDPKELTVRLHIRKSGYQRPLVFNNNRIHELYKLGDYDLQRALLGIDSTVPVFRADELEDSDYCKLMAFKNSCVTREIVQGAYGYNAISKLIADTPTDTRLSSNQKVIDVPYGLTDESTAFEYDVDGSLLGWHLHLTGSIYAISDFRTERVELIAGYTDDILDEVYGQQVSAIDPENNYRFYTCPIVNGHPNNKWVDVTGSGNYAIANNQVTWLINPLTTYTLVRGDSVNLGYDLNLPMTDGVLRFSLTHRATRDNQMSTYVMQIPMGELDIFLNGKSLIEDIDYFVRFPEIVIISKEHLVNPETDLQSLMIRFSGFCKPDMTRARIEDIGFIDHGLLSNNNRFDIRDDKVLRITVGGALKKREELEFAENDSGVTAPDARNGHPYLIRDIVVPLRGLTDEDTYSLRAKSMVIDKQVSDYMTLKMPGPVFPTPNVIEARYELFSPFCCKIMNDLNSGVIDDPRLKDHYNDEVVYELVEPYLPLLKYDPTQPEQTIDPRYVIIHPHNLYRVVDMDIYNYKFLERATRIFLNNQVALSHFIRISPT